MRSLEKPPTSSSFPDVASGVLLPSVEYPWFGYIRADGGGNNEVLIEIDGTTCDTIPEGVVEVEVTIWQSSIVADEYDILQKRVVKI